MKLNKTVKKIAALSLGASMVGATLLGAMATADLGNFPSMFINADGKFDGVFVVGKNSKAEDIIGQNMLVSAVQVVAVKKTPIVGAAVTKTVSDGYEIGNKDLYINKSVAAVDDKFTDSDLPTLLAEGTFIDNEGNNKGTDTYKQKITLPETTVPTGQAQTLRIVHEQDDDAAPNAGVYLFIKDSNTYYTYNYSLTFDSPINVDNSSSASMSADLEGTKIKILGKDYSIVDVKYTSSDMKEIKFLGGESLAWMSQGEKVTVKVSGTEHTVEMVDVTEVASSGEVTACGFLIDGQSAWIDKGTTETINGVVVGVTDGKAIHSEAQTTDVCQVAIGANSVLIRDNQEVKLNDEKISDVSNFYAIGYIEYALDGQEDWKSLSYRVNPDEDKLYLSVGDEMVDPVFGAFKLVYNELVEGDKEKIEIKSSGKNAELKFLNKDSKEIKLDFKSSGDANNILYAGSTVTSTEVDDMIYFENTTCKGSSSVTECKGAKFLVSVGSNCEAHLIKVSNINTVDTKISFEDETYGTETNDYDYTAGTAFDPGLSGVSDTSALSFTVSTTAINFTNLGSCYTTDTTPVTNFTNPQVRMKTKNEGYVFINYSLSDQKGNNLYDTQGSNFTQPRINNISFAEYYDTGSAISNTVFICGESSGACTNGHPLIVTPNYDSTSDNVLELAYDSRGLILGTSDTKYAFAKNDMSDTDDDNKQTLTFKGTWITLDDDSSKQSIVIEHPKVATYGRVFVAPTTATTAVSTAGTYTTEIQQIGVDQFKLDTEVTDVTAVNVVAVGGPCANSVVSALMGNPAECFTAMGIETGQGMIKLFEDATTGKVALVVAGQTAEDTRLASQMVANYASYALKGDEVVAITVNEAALSWKTKAELAAEAAAAPAPAVEEVPVVEETIPTE
ncbi:hypothetical protein J4434_06445 [Candidatus Woesearchaeota archaeon]|nr:hypothetical protein [Candidatus Woesearchaeota archaeon]